MLGSQSNLATIMGCSESYIGKLDRKGDPRIIKRAGQIDLDASAEALVKSGFGKRSGKAKAPKGQQQGGSGAYSIDEERLELEKEKIREQIRKLKLETDVKEGQYLDKDEAEHYIFDRFRNFRDAMLAIPGRIAPRCVDQDQHAVERTIYDEVHRALTDLANGVQSDFPGLEKTFQEYDFHKKFTMRLIQQMLTDLENGDISDEDRELLGFIDPKSIVREIRHGQE